MHQMIELHPRPDALSGLGLPAIPYPVALQTFQAAVANDGELPLADMLHGLQLRAARPGADWQRMEPAMARLAELLAPDDPRESIIAQGEDWWLELGPVEPEEADALALQRGDALLAAIAPREDGRLRVAAYRPLDGRALEILLALASVPGASAEATDPRTCWERAQEAASGTGPHASALDGLARLSRGQPADADLAPRKPACVVAEIGTFHMLHRAQGAERRIARPWARRPATPRRAMA
ncbi:hypothetical protein [Luteimonas granuli]|uniref:Uncharacterized protein n=1 Tax=Luteimonas granuli TaxID=1176533 RepID=A0A518N275_9GAMM|nr:hypothetical protein [Luteimonas granuli]QDW66023.1 hypothetical protein FPZ22_03215 [Luteimonas granuli]